MTGRPDTTGAAEGMTPIEFAFRMGEAFGSINAKLDHLRRLYGIDPDGEEARRAVEEAKSRLTTTKEEK